MAFWGIELKPGKPFIHSPDKAGGRLRISQATLGIGSSNNKSLVQCNVGKKSPVLLCSLLPGVLETCHLELEFEEAQEVIFSVIGARSVHLTGYYLSNVRHLGGIDESESYGEDIGDTDTERSDGHNNDEDEYEDSFIDDGDPEVFPPSPSSDEGKKKTKKKKKADSLKCRLRRLKKKYELSESEDDYVPSKNDTSSDHIRGQIVESGDYDQLPISSMLGNVKTVTEDPDRNGCDSDENQSEERKGKGRKRKSDKENEAPTVSTTGENQSAERNVKKKKRKSGEENEAPAINTISENQSEVRKDKKKKRKDGKENEAPTDTESPQDFKKTTTTTTTTPQDFTRTKDAKTELGTQTVSGGLVVEDLEIGDPDGKVAASGKKVTIHYTGKLKEGGQVFDSTVGKDPLKFRLGKGDALDGLDLGIEGMQVGGKRRLLIPPALGFGEEGSKRVPPNSCLIMDVELLWVR